MKTALDTTLGPKKQCERLIFLPWKLTGKRKAARRDFGENAKASPTRLEPTGKRILRDAGVFSPKYFDPDPYMALMDESHYVYKIENR